MSRKLFASLPLFAIVLWLFSTVSCATTKNGFRLDGASIPVEEIFQGGPPRDGIPSIDRPEFISASQAGFLEVSDRVLGINLNGVIRAYPISILNWHEIVNDVIAGQPVVITFCPLCGTGMAFDAQKDGKALEFGVSGLLYQSDVLLYDRETFSLWSQVMREAVTGQFKGETLTQLPLEHTTWGSWRSRYPDTQVLSTNTGFSRNYEYTPYGGYEESSRLFFDVNHPAPAIYHPKEQVLGLVVGGESKAYPFTELSKKGASSFEDIFSGRRYTIHWDEQARSAYILDETKVPVVTTTAFWFAWYTFHPDTLIFKAPRTQSN